VSGLVLSLFPGIGLLDRAFEDEGFCVVRGPDLLWGGDVRTFHPPAGRFDGVIGGPPCQRFSPIGNVNRARWGDDSVLPDLIPEFRRVVVEAAPHWWVMENSPHAYAPFDAAHVLTLDTAWLGERQARRRRFWSNLPLRVDVPALVPMDAGSERAVSAHGSVDWKGSRAREEPRTLGGMLELQGFPADLLEHGPFTVSAAKKMVGNGVPLPMGRAVARAVKRALTDLEAAA
jgi:DNA (cytosine-5)-methyltransferase 1